jgi:glycosyltransferase involved in cell wall biosynthesis
MKIGYLLQAGAPDVHKKPFSGPALHVRQVFSELQSLGHQVRLLAFLNGRIWKSDDLEHFEAVRVGIMDGGPLRWFERLVRRIQSELRLPYAALFESLRFALACRQELSGFDLFYERIGWVGYGSGLASRWMELPLVLEVNGDHLSEFKMLGVEPLGAQRWLSIRLMSWAAKQAAHVVATGEGWRQKFIDRWGTDPSKVSVIENGSQLVDLLEREQLRSFSSNGVAGEQVNLVYLGAFEPWHGLTVFLHAAAKLRTAGINAHLTLIGSGSELANVRALAEELQFDERVTFTGHLPADQLPQHLAQADIGVSPYCGRVEYSGLKLLDYKAAGLAIVASGENGQPSVLQHGKSGWIVPPGDDAALFQALLRLSKDCELRKHIGRQARLDAEGQHSWRHTALQLQQLFKQVLAA